MFQSFGGERMKQARTLCSVALVVQGKLGLLASFWTNSGQISVGLKWSWFFGQFSGFAKMYLVVDHAAAFSFSPAKNAWSGVRLSSAVCGRSAL